MNLKMYALIGTIGGAAVALGVHHGGQFLKSREQISEYHREMMLASQQPLEEGGDSSRAYPEGALPLDATPEPGYLPEPGSARPIIQYKGSVPLLPPIESSSFITVRKTREVVPKTKDPVWQVSLVSKDGVVLDSMKAVTGRAYRQTANRNVSGTKAPLPSGKYQINRSGIERGPFDDPELGKGYWIPVTPLFRTGRSDLGFHVDPSWGKLNGESGTSGCIGLENVDATVKLVTWIKQLNVSKLIVVD